MRQQIAERDRSHRLVSRVERSLRIAQYAQVRELRCADRDQIVQRESPLVEQHQSRDCRHRLGQRCDAEDGIPFDWKPARQVAAPDGGCADDLAVAPRQRGGANKLSGVHELPDRNFNSVFGFYIEDTK
jgi:hypothetical protein